jgi:hypothetical protein
VESRSVRDPEHARSPERVGTVASRMTSRLATGSVTRSAAQHVHRLSSALQHAFEALDRGAERRILFDPLINDVRGMNHR